MKKVVLVSKSGYSDTHDGLLESLVARQIELFCVVGVDCELWHDVMDEIVVGPDGKYEHHIDTTWHENETVEHVVRFAEEYQTPTPSGVEIIEV